MEIENEIHLELRKKYNPEGSELRKAQYRMLEVLKYLDKICTENHLNYWLDGGTLLGAKRHDGFIPWDDDTDVVMPREDLMKLRKYLKNHKNENYILQNHSTDNNYFSCWDVLRDTRSEYIQNSTIHNIRKYRGLQVDIFPQIKNPNQKLWGLSNSFQTRFINNLITSHYSLLYVRLNWFIFNIILKPIIRLISACIPCKNNIYTYDFGIYFGYKHKEKNIFPLKKISFEGYQFSCPNNVEAYLTEQYGDWKKLPEPNSIHTHNIIVKFL